MKHGHLKYLSIILAVAGVAILVGVLCAYWIKTSSHRQANPEASQQLSQVTTGTNQQPAANPGLTITDDHEDTYSLTSVTEYTIGPVEVTIHPLVQDDSKQIFNPGWFEVDAGIKKIFASQPNFNVSNLFAFQWQGNEYLVVGDYSGGAHCCYTDYLFWLNAPGGPLLIKTMDTGNGNVLPDSLIVKDNVLYVKIYDDRFQYFHIDYADSYFFVQYYRLDKGVLTLADDDFKQEFIDNQQKCKNNLAQDSGDSSRSNYWLNDIVCDITNATILGNQASALQDYSTYFDQFFPSGQGVDMFSEPFTKASLEKEITDALQKIDYLNQ